MDKDCADILLENFRECLKVYQHCIMWANGASFSLFLFSWRLHNPGGAETRVVLLFGDVSLSVAWILALGAYFALSIFASYSLWQAHNIIEKFETKPEIVSSLAMYPSLATHPNAFVRIAAPFSPSALVVMAMIFEISRLSMPLRDYPWLGLVVFLIIVASVCVKLIQRVARPPWLRKTLVTIPYVNAVPDHGSETYINGSR